MFGQNSFALGDTTNTGLDSGLDTTQSDYVARLSYQPNSTYMFTSRFRFDNDTFDVNGPNSKRAPASTAGTVACFTATMPPSRELGILDRQQGILGTGQVKLDANWVLIGAARYDINAGKFDQTRFGLGYVDDCLILGLNYITNYTIAETSPPTIRSCCS